VEGASVSVDGTELGPAPLVTHLGRGLHAVEVSSAGYAPWRRDIQVEPRVDQTLEATLDVAPGTLVVTSEPTGAEVSLDGDALGRTPVEREVAGGGHIVEVRLEGHRTAQRRAVVPFGQRTSVEVALEPAAGTLSVATDAADATLEVDGEDRGTSPFPPLDLTPGRHRLRVAARRSADWSGEVDVLDARTTAVEVELASTRGVHQAWFWSTLVLTLGTLVGGALLTSNAVDNGALYLDTVRLIEDGGQGSVDLVGQQDQGESYFRDTRQYLISGLVLLATSGLAAIATLVLGLRTRFRQHESRANVRVEQSAPGAPPDVGGAP